MSNSTLPLGFLHSNTELVTCGQLLYFMILRQRELGWVFQPCGSNEVHLSYYFATYLHLIIGMNDELRVSGTCHLTYGADRPPHEAARLRHRRDLQDYGTAPRGNRSIINDGFRLRGHSSHFYAIHPRNGGGLQLFYGFSVSNRQGARGKRLAFPLLCRFIP